MNLKEAYSYDDVTLVPVYSELNSRSAANPTIHGYKMPIIGSCMDVFSKEMMQMLANNNVPFIAHRAFKSAEEQYLNFFPNYEKQNSEMIDKCVWFAVGSMQKYKDWIFELYERFGVRNFCVDMAHGDSKACVDTIKYIRSFDTNPGCSLNKKCHIIAGNIASVDGFKRLQKAGADGIRVGVASGQICFTPNTKVWCVSNSGKIHQKEIKFIDIGETVITARGRYRKVVNKFINEYTGEVYKINNDIVATPNHKFYMFDHETGKKVFLEIKEYDSTRYSFLNPELRTYKAEFDIDEYTGNVYNIEVEDEHSYCVGNLMFGVSNCSTALQTGFGVPILTNIIDCAKIKKNTWLIADGGCRFSGDIAKAIYFGADFVMIGKLLAATNLATGACFNRNKVALNDGINRLDSLACVYPHEFETKYKIAEHLDNIEKNNKHTAENPAVDDNYYKNMCINNVVAYKEYHGMASRAARAGVLSYASVEGVEGLIEYTGTTEEFLNDTYLHLQASLSYGGVTNWKDFKKKVKAVKRSNAGIIAADTHLDFTTGR